MDDWGCMQAITVLGLGLCLAVLYFRAQLARRRAPSSIKQRFKAAHLLIGALLAWLVISMNLQHLNRALSGEAPAPPSMWEQVIQTLSDWGI